MFTELEKYLEQVKSDKTATTLRGYSTSLIRFCDSLKIESAKQIQKLSSSNIQDYLYGLKNAGLSASSVNSHARNIMVFFKWLNENGYKNELHIKKMKESKTIKPVPSEEEIKNILGATSGQRKLLIAMMCFTGLRREEAANIKISDIQNCHLTINGKGRKQRRLLLHDDICKLLNKWLAKRDVEFEYLFYSRRTFAGNGDGTPHKLTGDTINRIVKAGMLKGGLSPERIATLGAHSLRRFFAVYLLKNNASLSQIQVLLGHESALTTALYLRSAGAEIAENEIRSLPSLM
jgi:site-specific recombinase XerD